MSKTAFGFLGNSEDYRWVFIERSRNTRYNGYHDKACFNDATSNHISRMPEKVLEQRLSSWDITTKALNKSIADALAHSDIIEFGKELSNVHGKIHIGFGCR